MSHGTYRKEIITVPLRIRLPYLEQFTAGLSCRADDGDKCCCHHKNPEALTSQFFKAIAEKEEEEKGSKAAEMEVLPAFQNESVFAEYPELHHAFRGYNLCYAAYLNGCGNARDAVLLSG